MCKFEELIDDYLLNRLPDAEVDKFEEHYFNCSHCFQELQDRSELISVIKSKGDEIFRDMEIIEKPEKISLIGSLSSFLTPKHWLMVAVSAILVVIVVVGIIPTLKKTAPQFYVSDDLVRGESIALISPVLNIKDIPSYFRWKKEGNNVEYKVSIYKDKLLWSTTTKDNFITLPEDIKKLIQPGEQYSWQVKAFSPEGTLIAVSSRVRFMIAPDQQ
jgi:hypothetical protein